MGALFVNLRCVHRGMYYILPFPLIFVVPFVRSTNKILEGHSVSWSKETKHAK